MVWWVELTIASVAVFSGGRCGLVGGVGVCVSILAEIDGTNMLVLGDRTGCWSEEG